MAVVFKAKGLLFGICPGLTYHAAATIVTDGATKSDLSVFVYAEAPTAAAQDVLGPP